MNTEEKIDLEWELHQKLEGLPSEQRQSVIRVIKLYLIALDTERRKKFYRYV